MSHTDNNRLVRLSLLALTLLTMMSGCSNTFNYAHAPNEQDAAPTVSRNWAAIPDALPRVEPAAEYGNPKKYTVFGKSYQPLLNSEGFKEQGIGSWYGTKFHGRLTSSREPYDMYAMTAAHKTLPLPTYVEVTNLDNGKKIIVKVNDRGPFHDNRIIDLSYAAAMKIGYGDKGTGRVEIRAIDPRRPTAHRDKAPVSAPIAATPSTTVIVGLARPDTGISVIPFSSPINRTPMPAPSPILAATKTAAPMYLQVGAFSSRINAENLRSSISEMSSEVPVLISQISNDQAAAYRVRVGPLSGHQEAEKITALLVMIGINNPRVVFD